MVFKRLSIKQVLLAIILSILGHSGYAQRVELTSPNDKIKVSLFNTHEDAQGDWFLKVFYNAEIEQVEIIPQIE